MMNHTLYHGDCLDILPTLPAQSVDAIICDPPYGTTNCKWDSAIPFPDMWQQIKRVIKPRGAVVLFCTQPFTSALVMSNPNWFKHQWVWDKKRGNGHLVAKFRPMQRTEDIAVFCKSSPAYFPQMVKLDKPVKFHGSPTPTDLLTKQVYQEGYTRPDYTHKYPTNLLHFPWTKRDGLHPTQKPVELMAYLIRTYSKVGDTVLDFTMGSGSTGIAAVQEDRHFIGIEKEENYFEIAKTRIGLAAMVVQANHCDDPGEVVLTDDDPDDPESANWIDPEDTALVDLDSTLWIDGIRQQSDGVLRLGEGWSI